MIAQRGYISVRSVSFSFPLQAQESSAHPEPSKSHFALTHGNLDTFRHGSLVVAVQRECLRAEQAPLGNCLSVLHVLGLCSGR